MKKVFRHVFFNLLFLVIRAGDEAGVAPLVEWRLSRKLLLRSLQKQMEDVASGIHTTDASVAPC